MILEEKYSSEQNPKENLEHSLNKNLKIKTDNNSNPANSGHDFTDFDPDFNQSNHEDNEEVLVDFSKLKKKVKVLFKGTKKEFSKDIFAGKNEIFTRKETEDNSEALDFGKVKEGIKNMFKGLKNKSSVEKKDDEELSFDFRKIVNFTKTNAKWLIPLFCIILAMAVSTHFRMMPSSLPITDGWAENTVYNFYKGQIENQINQQYPHLPPQNKAALVEKEWNNLLKENKDKIEKDIVQLSQQYKNSFQDENGETYLPDIDTYLWYGEAKNVINYGHLGNSINEQGVPIYSLRNGRLDKTAFLQLHPYICAYLFKFLNIFSNVSLMRSFFLLPAIIIGLSLIPAFFIGRRISGNIGGLFSALFLAINGPLLGRTAGVVDTDPYNVFFPLLIAWFFIEAYYSKNSKTKWSFLGLSGLSVGLYSITWQSGWGSGFVIVLVTIIAVIGFDLIKELIKNKMKLNLNLFKSKPLKENLILFFGLMLTSGLFVTLFKNLNSFIGVFSRIVRFTNLKEVGVKSIWPNVLTTVAEFNVTSFSNIINQMGGNFLFTLAIIGLLITMLKKKNGKRDLVVLFILITIWLIATAYAFTKGTRFAVLIAPPFAIALGSAFGFIYEKVSRWLNKGINLNLNISRILIIIILCLFLITPFSTAKSIARNSVPGMNDAWYDTLIKIKNDSPDSIITSWWDFGHWFTAIAERRVTFDGGDQGERIHWVGRSLITNHENEARGILRMLNCAQETAPHQLNKFINDELKSIQIIKEVILISNQNEAKQKYLEFGLSNEQAETMLAYTHCEDLLPNYFITSDDMVGKAGVWGHFGTWDFGKAVMYQNTINLSREKAIKYLLDKFDLTSEEADKIHEEIQTTAGDRWIAPWPGFFSSLKHCSNLPGNKLSCVSSINGMEFTMEIDLNAMNITIVNNPNIFPYSIVYPTEEGIEEKKLENGVGFSVMLVPDTDSFRFLIADPLQISGMFAKLYFLEGHGLKCFQKFDDVMQIGGGRIITWKIDYDCQQENKVFFSSPPAETEMKKAAAEVNLEEVAEVKEQS